MKLNEQLRLHWKVWERRVDRLLRANGWTFFHDKVKPKRFAGANKVRTAGLPDFVAHKVREDGVATILFLECKTGKAVVTDQQRGWIDAADKCEGTVGMVVYPRDIERLARFLGGERE